MEHTQIKRNLVAVIEVTPLGESCHPALRSIAQAPHGFLEVHVVGAGPQASLQRTCPSFAQLKTKLEKSGIRVVVHSSQLAMKRIGAYGYYLVNIPSLCSISPDALKALRAQIAATRKYRTRWSVSGVVVSRVASVWHALTLMTLLYNWLRGMWTNLWKTQDGQDICVKALWHSDELVVVKPDSGRFSVFRRERETTTQWDYHSVRVEIDHAGSPLNGFFYMARRQRNTGWFALVFLTLFALFFFGLPYYTWSGADTGIQATLQASWLRSGQNKTKRMSWNEAFQQAEMQQQQSSWAGGLRFLTVLVGVFCACTVGNRRLLVPYWLWLVLLSPALWVAWVPLMFYGRYFSRRTIDYQEPQHEE